MGIYRLGEHTLLVRIEMITKDVAVKTGVISKNDSKNGVVIKASHTYVGYFDGRLWDWFDRL